MSLFRTKRSAVGLEIGSNSARAVELFKSVPYEITRYAVEPLSNGAVVDGEIVEVDEVAQALKNLWQRGRFSTKKVVLGIANPKVLVRQVELPFMEDSELKSAINFQAQEYIPFPPDELVLDYHVLGKFENEDKQQMLEVLLVAANKEMVQNFCSAAQNADLQVEVVYLSALALSRALLDQSIAIEDENTKPVVIANMSTDITNIVVAEKGFARFARIMTFGGNDFSDALISNLSLSAKEAEEFKIKIGLIGKGSEADVEPDPQMQKISSILSGIANKFSNELKRSIEYYFSNDMTSETIDRLVLTGGGSMMPGFEKYISEKLKIQTERGRALDRVSIAKNIDMESSRQMLEHESTLSVLIGLAMRGLA